VTPPGSRLTFAWWVAIGVAELVLAIALIVYGYWWTLFVSLPASGICAYFARREWERLNG
jgi:uncharacterized membrane protein